MDSVVEGYHAGFNRSIHAYSQILRLFTESRLQVEGGTWRRAAVGLRGAGAAARSGGTGGFRLQHVAAPAQPSARPHRPDSLLPSTHLACCTPTDWKKLESLRRSLESARRRLSAQSRHLVQQYQRDLQLTDTLRLLDDIAACVEVPGRVQRLEEGKVRPRVGRRWWACGLYGGVERRRGVAG